MTATVLSNAALEKKKFWIFSARAPDPTLIRQLILLFLHQPLPFALGNDDLGHLVQVTPNFFLTCDTFMIVTTPSVAD